MPKRLKLISCEATDLQGGGGVQFDRLRMFVVLDGYPVRKLEWKQKLEDPKEFSNDENLTDEDMSGSEEPFVFWSFADLTIYEADTEGQNWAVDSDTDEWIQNVRLDHRELEELEVGNSKVMTVEIGKLSGRSFLAPGREDCRYKLTFSLTEEKVRVDEGLFARLVDARVASEYLGHSELTGDFDADKGDCKWICAIDGGGLRGIFPLRVLEQMERYYDRSCFEMFDMFAGTSTGSMIAAALATGRPLQEVIALYADDVTRKQIFASNKKGQHHAFRYLDLTRMSAGGQDEDYLNDALSVSYVADRIESYTGLINAVIRSAAEQIITPRYRKIGMKEVLYQLLSARAKDSLIPFKLSDCGKGSVTKDILITARDLDRNETTLFTAFHIPHSTGRPLDRPAMLAAMRRVVVDEDEMIPRETVDVVTGLYQDVLLKDAVEASSSAPVYFAPRGRFTDGGVGPYNNPSFIGAFEALNRSHIDTRQDAVTLSPKYTAYSEAGGSKSGTVVWSFGTAFRRDFEAADTANLVGGSLSLNQRSDTVLYWIEKVIDNLMFGASQEQVFLCREVLRDQIKFLRVNLGVTLETLDDLGSGDFAEDLASIKLDAVKPAEFENMDNVAKKFALQARNARFGFSGGGFEYPNPALEGVDIETYAAFVKDEFTRFE